MPMWKVGDSRRRYEDPKLVRGEGSYADDRAPAGTLEMVVLRSQTAAARLLSIDVSEAREMPGVVDILVGSEQERDGIRAVFPRLKHPGPDGGDMRMPDVRPLAIDLVQYVGHPIAAVVARTRAQAEDAAEAILLDLDEREPVTDALEAVREDAPKVWPNLPDNRCFRFEQGDGAAVDAALARAAHVTRARLKISRVTAVALEPRVAVASWTEEDGYRLEVGTQSPHRIRADLAPVLGEEQERIRVVSKETGGSFGMKNFGYFEYALALWAAKRCGGAVRWRASRNESFLSDAHARDQWVDAALALDASGRILALDMHSFAALGACLGPATTHPPVANLGGLAGVYRTPAIRAVVEGVFVNCQMVAPYRGAGRPEATYVIERMIDIAAAETKRDRVELRRINMITPDQMPFATGLVFKYDSGDFPAVMEKALAAADWSGFEKRRAQSAGEGRLRGIGIANPIEIAGGPAGKPHPEYTRLFLAPQGNARLVVGSCDAGQGHATTFRQILSERLGIDPEAIELVTGDTGLVERGTGTFGSRTTMAVSSALNHGMNLAIEQILPVAARLLDAEAPDVQFADGCFKARSGATVSFLEALAAHGEPIEEESHVAPDGATFPNGCHVCEVEIDPDTGQVEVVRYTVVDDVGTVVNPLIVEGQIAGGVAQGLGQALMEEIVHEADSGQMLTATFMDYQIPRASDMPWIDVASHPVPTRLNPLGVKGVGEAGTVGALSAGISAVADALSARGFAHIDMPATPNAVWRALHRAEV